jgi:hypothetical protein
MSGVLEDADAEEDVGEGEVVVVLGFTVAKIEILTFAPAGEDRLFLDSSASGIYLWTPHKRDKR